MNRFIGSIFLALSLVLAACEAQDASTTLTRYEYAQLHMGVKVRLVVYAPDEPTAERACEAAYQRVARLEDTMSDYRPSSELMRLCARAGGPPVPVSTDLFLVLQHSCELARRSDGAFDPTVGPLVVLWRKARKAGQLPTDGELQQARALVGWQKVRLDPKRRTVELLQPGMRLDLGGIAKGYAGDCAIAVLKQRGIRSALFEAGGDIVVSGPPPGKPGWRVDVPGAGPGGTTRTLAIANAAVSTSGDTEQFVEIGGRCYSHIVDPRTGLGLTTHIAVTIVARSGLTSDGLSTAVSVLGPERGPALIRGVPGAVLYVRTSGEP